MGAPELLGNAGLVYSAIVSLLVFAGYGLLAPWHRSEFGRLLITTYFVIGTVLGMGTIRLFLGDAHWFQVLRAVVFLGVPLFLTWHLAVLVRVQILPSVRSRREKNLVD